MMLLVLTIASLLAATTSTGLRGSPSPPHSACADVQRELNAAIKRADPVFELPSGGIDCPVDFVVLGAEDLILIGAPDNSTTFWFDPRMAGFTVMNSRNVTVRNVAIDHNPLPYIQLDITKVTRNTCLLYTSPSPRD